MINLQTYFVFNVKNKIHRQYKSYILQMYKILTLISSLLRNCSGPRLEDPPLDPPHEVALHPLELIERIQRARLRPESVTFRFDDRSQEVVGNITKVTAVETTLDTAFAIQQTV